MRAPWVLAGILLVGCLQIEPGQRTQPRYFTPEAPAALGAPGGSGLETLLRLRRVRAAAHLKERIVWRRSDVEFGFRELARWTQLPAAFADQWLARELFERRGLRRAVAGPHPVLEIELRAFDDVLEPGRLARVELAVLLLDARGVALLERSYVSEQAFSGEDPAELARGMGAALQSAVEELADGVVGELAQLEGRSAIESPTMRATSTAM